MSIHIPTQSIEPFYFGEVLVDGTSHISPSRIGIPLKEIIKASKKLAKEKLFIPKEEFDE